MSGGVDQHGLVTNVLADGLELDFSTSTKEFIDNSIDAGGKKMNIALNNKGDYYEYTIEDNGVGMDYKYLKKYVTLCKRNMDPSKNGKYGLGSKAALVNLSKSNNDSLNMRSLILSSGIDNSEILYTEIEIDWNKINDSIDNENVWTDNVKYQNMSISNYNYWNSLNKERGVLIKTTISKDYFEDIDQDIKTLLYNIKKTYHYECKSNSDFEINFTTNIDSINNETINSENTLDFIHYDEIKSNSSGMIDLSTFPKDNLENLAVYAKLTINYNSNTKNFSAKCNETNLDGYENSIREFSDSDSDSDMSFEYNIVWVDKEIGDNDTKITRDYLNSTNSNWTAGLYFIRNNRILGNPISLNKIRTNQTHTKWRAVMIVNNNDTISKMVSVGVKKTEIKKDNIDKKLYKYLSDITRPLVDKCVGFISSTYKCKKCNKTKDHCECCSKKGCEEKCNCCRICNKTLEKCTCCKTCFKSKKDCECCKKCKKIQCTCCETCEKTKEKCKCGKCKKCHNSKCECCECCKKPPGKCTRCKRCNQPNSSCECCVECNQLIKDCDCFEDCIGCGKQNFQCICCKKCHKVCDICSNPNCNEKVCDFSCNCKEINGNWHTIVDNTIHKDNVLEQYDMVYLVQPSEQWNTNVYKIGKTTQNINKSNIINRFKGLDYGDYLKQIFVCEVKNADKTEKLLIKAFKKQFQRFNKKNEYFIGDIEEMKRIFLQIILNE